jgi:DNA-directed RNA polymerase subunit RPC12/RpoP
MEVDYIECNHCGYEAHNVYVAYSRQTADGKWWWCPECNREVNHVVVEED